MLPGSGGVELLFCASGPLQAKTGLVPEWMRLGWMLQQQDEAASRAHEQRHAKTRTALTASVARAGSWEL